MPVIPLEPDLAELEAEAIAVIREAYGQFDRAAILFSGGKDSVVLSLLAQKAFFPAPFPFPLLHVDTGHNFPETLAFRDEFAAGLKAKLIIAEVAETIAKGRAIDEEGPNASRNAIQSVTLLDAIADLGLDAVMGGARRDEEKARAKERFFSLRSVGGGWEPKNQRPELWSILNGAKSRGEHFRVFPLSNWTERDIWRYIVHSHVSIPSLYFAHIRPVFRREGVLFAETEFKRPLPHETSERLMVRFRTVGDATCTAAFESNASTLAEVLREVEEATTSERSGRIDDKASGSAMEDRKRQGYF